MIGPWIATSPCTWQSSCNNWQLVYSMSWGWEILTILERGKDWHCVKILTDKAAGGKQSLLDRALEWIRVESERVPELTLRKTEDER